MTTTRYTVTDGRNTTTTWSSLDEAIRNLTDTIAAAHRLGQDISDWRIVETITDLDEQRYRTAAKKIDRLEKIIRDAPHEAGCGTQQGRACTSICWKSKLKDI